MKKRSVFCVLLVMSLIAVTITFAAPLQIIPLPNLTQNVTNSTPVTNLTVQDLKSVVTEAISSFNSQQKTTEQAIADFYSTKPSLAVHGTEYTRGLDTAGKIFVQIIAGNSTIDNATCAATAYFPDNTKFFSSQLMTFVEHGLYGYDFSIAANQTLGVYPTTVSCIFPSNTTNVTASTFQLNRGTNPSGVLGDTNVSDNVDLRIQESLLVTVRNLDTLFNFTNTGISANTTSVVFHVESDWNGGGTPAETIQLFAFNFSSGSYVQFPNSVIAVGGDGIVENFLPQPFTDFANNGLVIIRVNDSASAVDGANTNYDIDYMVLTVVNLAATPVARLQGSGELHISESPTVLISNILSEINQTTHRTEQNTLTNNATLMQVLGIVQQINITTLQNLALSAQINGTSNSILAIVTDTNATVYMNKVTLAQILSVSQDTKNDTTLIYNTLLNLTIGNITITANVNTTQIIDILLGADVQETVISSPFTASAAPSFLGGVAFAQENGVNAICQANSTLLTTLTKLRCVNNQCSTIQTNTTQTCQFGCNAGKYPNECNPSPSQSSTYMIAVVLIIIIILAFVIARTKR